MDEPLLRFWFRFMCREGLAGFYEREGVTATFEIGEYWDKATQIDLVGLRQDGWTDSGGCKWGENTTPGQIVAGLLQRIPRYPKARNATIAPARLHSWAATLGLSP